ncbi:hypothetical protein M407DRAFT_17954 [Tulasnella calospora MUT 4182]|uniref:Uncharacterized protein n=1 Tax=Tulasnella calospora MUT 4182 TaxID=1051891 RepID=A0A0C3LGJ0_9AGAM|nr:hypothetical protein M407DRAFT_17954 [Tulasnella calospora MUT 4182]
MDPDADSTRSNSVHQGLPNGSTTGSTPALTASPAIYVFDELSAPPLPNAPEARNNPRNDELNKVDTAIDIHNLFQNIGGQPPSKPDHSSPGAPSVPSSSNPLVEGLLAQVDAFTNALLAEFSSTVRPPHSQEKKVTTVTGAACNSDIQLQEGGPLVGSSANGEEARGSK